MAKYKMHTLAIMAMIALFGAGCANSHGPEASLIDALARHESSILEIVQTGDRVAAERLPGDAITSATVALDLYDERGEMLVDWGLQIELREVRSLPDGAVEVDYIAGISRRELWDGETTDSFAEEFRQAVIREGEVVDVITLGPGDESFDRIRLLAPMLPRETIRRMPGDPYAEPLSDTESTAGRAVLSLSSSSLRTYALTWCGPGRYNSYYPNYEARPSDGGDCTNFVSQCLAAGGLAFRHRDCSGLTGSYLTACRDRDRTWATYWWYNPPASAADHTNSWSTPNGLRPHMTERYGSPSATVHWTWEAAHTGDVVFVDFNHDGRWDHAMVVTTANRRADGSFDLRVSGHTSSRCDVDFYATARSWGGTAWIQIQHVL